MYTSITQSILLKNYLRLFISTHNHHNHPVMFLWWHKPCQRNIDLHSGLKKIILFFLLYLLYRIDHLSKLVILYFIYSYIFLLLFMAFLFFYILNVQLDGLNKRMSRTRLFIFLYLYTSSGIRYKGAPPKILPRVPNLLGPAMCLGYQCIDTKDNTDIHTYILSGKRVEENWLANREEPKVAWSVKPNMKQREWGGLPRFILRTLLN